MKPLHHVVVLGRQMNYPRARQLKVPLHFGGLMYHLFRSFRISYDASYHVLAIICLVQIVNSVTVRGTQSLPIGWVGIQ